MRLTQRSLVVSQNKKKLLLDVTSIPRIRITIISSINWSPLGHICLFLLTHVSMSPKRVQSCNWTLFFISITP
jgi:hypothetical protein